MKKKVLVGLVTVFVIAALALAACGTKENQPEPVAEPSGNLSPVPSGSGSVTPMTGGWQINETITAQVLTEESKKAFENAITEYTGMNLEPAALLGTQVVSGTNYLYLCKGQQVVPNPVPGWYLVVVYQNLEGKAEITGVKDFDIVNPKVTDEPMQAGLSGGWQIVDPSNAVALPADVKAAFEKATEGYTGLTLSPLALLGSQVVAGRNYKVFCQGTAVTAEPVNSLYVATVYVDLEGNAEFTDVQQLDILAYLQ